jgi:ribose/xylose/arabinose/galactoside ABC-type transport system permease subunit
MRCRSCALGAVNALLVSVFRIPAIVATLGPLAIYRGGVIVLAGGRQISATALPDSHPLITGLTAVANVA